MSGDPTSVQSQRTGLSPVLVDTPSPVVFRILLNRPDARNAIDASVRARLADALTQAEEDQKVRAVLLGGAEGMFCAGGDLPSMVGLSAEVAHCRLAEGHAIVSRLWRFPKPIVVALERFAIGAGAGLALLADHIVMGGNAVLGLPFVKLGLVPDWGLMTTLPWRIGNPAAHRLFLESAIVSAQDALALKIVDETVESAFVMQHALARAEMFARHPAQTFARMKVGLRCTDIETALEAERNAQVACLTGAEFAEGYAAFREKRLPDFQPLGNVAKQSAAP
jgi:2-(1,2-epoxy-1,2-dihydrophenyl)acetyl-CoA isomerase